MDSFVIQGGKRLYGRVRINGSKNAALPLMAAALLTDQPVTLRDVPDLADIGNMRKLLAELGCQRTNELAPDSPGYTPGLMTLHATDQSNSHARYEIVRTMRASICTLGPLLAKRGFARVSMPGGCAIGDRPVDLHLRGLAALGVEIILTAGDIIAKAPQGGLKGTDDLPGRALRLHGAGHRQRHVRRDPGQGHHDHRVGRVRAGDRGSRQPADRDGGQDQRVRARPASSSRACAALGGADHRVMPDRIEAGTFMCAAAITNGDMTLDNCPLDSLLADRSSGGGVHCQVLPTLSTGCRCGAVRACRHGPRAGGRARWTTRTPVLGARDLRPHPQAGRSDDPAHPGFPTDVQAQLMALLTPGGRQLGHHRADLPRALPARGGAVADGRQAPSARGRR
jgi:UDP-N-acetylglucosamine 1-carboxyvinyltransferase